MIAIYYIRHHQSANRVPLSLPKSFVSILYRSLLLHRDREILTYEIIRYASSNRDQESGEHSDSLGEEMLRTNAAILTIFSYLYVTRSF